MKRKLFTFLFDTSSPDLHRKHVRTLILAISIGGFIAIGIGVLMYIINRQGRF